MQIAFVGVGSMGTPMCRNVLGTGLPTMVWDIRPEATQRLEKDGASVARDLGQVAAEADLILLSLPGPKEVRDVVMESGVGLLAHGRPGTTILDLSTVDPITTNQIAEACEDKSITFIDSPVSGGVPGAISGTLTLMIGAEEREIEPYIPILSTIGNTFHYAGRRSSGATLKIVNNLIALCNMVTIGEALAIATKLGVSMQTFYDIVHSSSGNSYMLEGRVPKVLAGDKEPAFSISLGHKDLELAIQLCRDAEVPSFISSQAQQFYRLAQTKGMSDEDIASIVYIFQEMAGTATAKK